MCAERGCSVGDVGRAAEPTERSLHVHNGDRSLRRYAADVALDVFVDHDVPDDPDGKALGLRFQRKDAVGAKSIGRGAHAKRPLSRAVEATAQSEQEPEPMGVARRRVLCERASRGCSTLRVDGGIELGDHSVEVMNVAHSGECDPAFAEFERRDRRRRAGEALPKPTDRDACEDARENPDRRPMADKPHDARRMGRVSLNKDGEHARRNREGGLAPRGSVERRFRRPRGERDCVLLAQLRFGDPLPFAVRDFAEAIVDDWK